MARARTANTVTVAVVMLLAIAPNGDAKKRSAFSNPHSSRKQAVIDHLLATFPAPRLVPGGQPEGQPETETSPPSSPPAVSDLARNELSSPAPSGEPEPVTSPQVDPLIQYFNKETSIDHFGAAQYTNNNTFELRYFLVWPKTSTNASTPIFLFMGQEIETIGDMNVGSGYYAELAYNTGALQVWVEHRYYADNAPYLPADGFEHLTVEQAMVDHVEVVLHVQRVLSMDRAPVIAIGGSYSATLAAYMRIRYPDVIAGAVASSAVVLGCPGLGVDPSYDVYGWAKVATRAASTQAGAAAACIQNVQNFFKEVLAIAGTTEGLANLNKLWNTCPYARMTSVADVNRNVIAPTIAAWEEAAMYFRPHTTTPTSSSVGGSASRMCESLATPNLQGYDLLTAMQSALTNNDTSNTCLDGSSLSGSENLFLLYSGLVDAQVTNTGKSQAWQYQSCTQVPVFTRSLTGVSDMFLDLPFDVDLYDSACTTLFGVHTQYNWAATNFGLSAFRQSSNILFTVGRSDPWSSCSPGKDISDTVIVKTHDYGHRFDTLPSDPEDPDDIVELRQEVAQQVSDWVSNYDSQLQNVPVSNPVNLFNLAYNLGGYTAAVNDSMSGSADAQNIQALSASATQSNAAI